VHVNPDDPVDGRRLHPGDPEHGDVVSWLHDEAALLDGHHFDAWLDLLADDLVYRAPVRVTRMADDPASGSGSSGPAELAHFDETKASIATRVLRTKERTAWAEQPPSRTRHLVANVRVWAVEGGYAVRSALLFVRSRGGSPTNELLTGERRDELRSTASGLLLARREVLLDQAALGVSNLSTFL
jgi:3-phenylpropionate/cinnamic acid dioxygenase small subunit